jgi:hypothetical protein
VYTKPLPSNDRTHIQTQRLLGGLYEVLAQVPSHSYQVSLPSRCLAMKGGIHFTKPLPNNNRRDTHTDTQTDGRNLLGMPVSRDNVVAIATSYGLDDRGVGVQVPVGSRIFSSPRRPDRR